MLALAALALTIPLHFEPVAGTAATQAGYMAVAPHYRLALSDTAIDMQFPRGGMLRMNLPPAVPEAVDPLPGKTNYYSGTDPAGWRTGVPNYARIRYRSVFRGVDLVIYGDQHEIEYDWVVAAGADPAAIRFSFTGAAHMRVDGGGDLVLEAAGREIRHRKPRIYQMRDGRRVAVGGGFLLARNGQVRFRVGAYDRGRALTIDPKLVYSTGFGGSGLNVGLLSPDYFEDTGTGIGVDGDGNAYVTGITDGGGFPTLEGNGTVTVGDHAFLLALDTNGALLASQVVGGSGQDAGTSIALGPDGYLYLAGTTSSPNFPTTTGAYRTTPVSSQDLFLMKINPRTLIGSIPGGQSPIVYSTYVGPGSSAVVTADSAGNAYVAAATTSTAWTATPGAVQPRCAGQSCADAVAIKISPGGNSLLYMTYFGGSGTETLGGLVVDQSGNAYISGGTTSTDLPTTNGSFQAVAPAQIYPEQTGFVAKLNPGATKLVYATYLGGNTSEQAFGIAVDGSGNAYVAGGTSSPNFPIVNAILVGLGNSPCYYTTPGGSLPSGESYCSSAGFVSVLNPAGSGLVWSTFLGTPNAYFGFADGSGLGADLSGPVYAVALDSAGNVYATGQRIGIGKSIVAGSPSDSVGVVRIAPQGSPLQFTANGLTSGASFLPGLSAPGGLASLFLYGLNVSGTTLGTGNPLPTELDAVSIFVDGFPAPLLAVANIPVSNPLGMQQINFQVPFEAQSNLVEVRYQGLSTYVLPQLVAPGIFTLPDGSGAIQHAADYSLVTASNPATPGETIIIYATGLGSVSTMVADGAPAVGADPIQEGAGQQEFSVMFGGTPPNTSDPRRTSCMPD
ncbi:MAG: SBBP repeat-containing protein [Bryobacteraceae bacterium]